MDKSRFMMVELVKKLSKASGCFTANLSICLRRTNLEAPCRIIRLKSSRALNKYTIINGYINCNVWHLGMFEQSTPKEVYRIKKIGEAASFHDKLVYKK